MKTATYRQWFTRYRKESILRQIALEDSLSRNRMERLERELPEIATPFRQMKTPFGGKDV